MKKKNRNKANTLSLFMVDIMMSLLDPFICGRKPVVFEGTVELQWLKHLWSHENYVRDRGSSS